MAAAGGMASSQQQQSQHQNMSQSHSQHTLTQVSYVPLVESLRVRFPAMAEEAKNQAHAFQQRNKRNLSDLKSMTFDTKPSSYHWLQDQLFKCAIPSKQQRSAKTASSAQFNDANADKKATLTLRDAAVLVRYKPRRTALATQFCFDDARDIAYLYFLVAIDWKLRLPLHLIEFAPLNQNTVLFFDLDIYVVGDFKVQASQLGTLWGHIQTLLFTPSEDADSPCFSVESETDKTLLVLSSGCTEKSKDGRTFQKLGVHVVWPRVYVAQNLLPAVRRYLVHKLRSVFAEDDSGILVTAEELNDNMPADTNIDLPPRAEHVDPGPVRFAFNWNDIFDVQVARHPTMRMLGSSKVEKCGCSKAAGAVAAPSSAVSAASAVASAAPLGSDDGGDEDAAAVPAPAHAAAAASGHGCSRSCPHPGGLVDVGRMLTLDSVWDGYGDRVRTHEDYLLRNRFDLLYTVSLMRTGPATPTTLTVETLASEFKERDADRAAAKKKRKRAVIEPEDQRFIFLQKMLEVKFPDVTFSQQPEDAGSSIVIETTNSYCPNKQGRHNSVNGRVIIDYNSRMIRFVCGCHCDSSSGRLLGKCGDVACVRPLSVREINLLFPPDARKQPVMLCSTAPVRATIENVACTDNIDPLAARRQKMDSLLKSLSSKMLNPAVTASLKVNHAHTQIVDTASVHSMMSSNNSNLSRAEEVEAEVNAEVTGAFSDYMNSDDTQSGFSQPSPLPTSTFTPARAAAAAPATARGSATTPVSLLRASPDSSPTAFLPRSTTSAAARPRSSFVRTPLSSPVPMQPLSSPVPFSSARPPLPPGRALSHPHPHRSSGAVNFSNLAATLNGGPAATNNMDIED